jgi:hypothetical protein
MRQFDVVSKNWTYTNDTSLQLKRHERGEESGKEWIAQRKEFCYKFSSQQRALCLYSDVQANSYVADLLKKKQS